MTQGPWSHLGSMDPPLSVSLRQACGYEWIVRHRFDMRQGTNPYFPSQEDLKSFAPITVSHDAATPYRGGHSLLIAGSTRPGARSEMDIRVIVDII